MLKQSMALKIIEEEGESYGEIIGNYLVGASDKQSQKESLGLLLAQSGRIEEACSAMQEESIKLSKAYF